MSMNTNKLKVTDLMVGDWVMSFGAPHKIIGVRTDMFEPHIKTDMSDTWYEEGIENLLEPIPLTPEILEKNGFETKKIMPFEQEFEHRVGVDGRVELDNRSEYIHSNNTWAMYIRGDRGFTSYIELSFLHEIQHALKLCKINKEIVV